MHARIRPAPLLALALASLLAGGCREGSAARDGLTYGTLPNGATLASNPEEGAWAPGEGWRLVESARIGAMDGDGPDVFGGSLTLALGADGRIYVGDQQAAEVRIFAPDGRHLRTVGRRGGGPGEFQMIIGMTWGTDGTLWVMDGQTRFTVLDAEGEFVTSHPRPAGFMIMPWPGRMDREGRLIDVNGFATGAEREWRTGLLRYDAGMVARDTLLLPPFEGESFTVSNDRGMRVMSAPVPFTPRQYWTLGPEGDLWVGVSDRYRIHRVDFSGDTVFAVERAYTPIPVSAAEKDEAEGQMEWIRSQGGRVDRSRFGNSKPAFGTLVVDGDGYLWVMAARREGEPRGLDVFDPEGRYLGKVELPEGVAPFVPPVIRGDRLVTVIRDELEVPHVVAFRIEGR